MSASRFAAAAVVVLALLAGPAFADGKKAGKACATNTECASNYCLDGRCKNTVADGAACAAHVECTSKKCMNGACE